MDRIDHHLLGLLEAVGQIHLITLRDETGQVFIRIRDKLVEAPRFEILNVVARERVAGEDEQIVKAIGDVAAQGHQRVLVTVRVLDLVGLGDISPFSVSV